MNGAGEQGGRVVVGFLQGIHSGLHRVAQGLGIGQAAVLGIELVPFIRAWRQFIQFADLPGQAFTLALQAVLGGARLRQCVLGQAPLLPALGQWLGGHLRIGVQQAANGVGAGQALPGMLAMDVHQLVGNLLELAGGCRAAIDPGPALALRINRAAQQQAVRRFEAGLLQPWRQTRGAVEFGADFAAQGALADHADIGTCAQRQLQRTNQYRFAGPGFTGENRKPIR